MQLLHFFAISAANYLMLFFYALLLDLPWSIAGAITLVTWLGSLTIMNLMISGRFTPFAPFAPARRK